MGRTARRLAIAPLLLAACNRATLEWRPAVMSHVPDGTPVRFSQGPRDEPVAGRALGWQSRAPRVVTPRGDTIDVPASAMLGVRLPRKAGHPVAGAILGAIVGVGVTYANCPEPKRYCGEENPTELLFTGLGGLVGSLIRTDHWVRVRWDPR